MHTLTRLDLKGQTIHIKKKKSNQNPETRKYLEKTILPSAPKGIKEELTRGIDIFRMVGRAGWHGTLER